MAVPLPDWRGPDRGALFQDYGASACDAGKVAKKLKRSGRRIRRYARLAGGRRFLDIGCNVGIAAEAGRRAGFEAMGIDVDAAAIDQARRLFPEVTYRAIAAQDLAAEGAQFDFIYSSEVIEHIGDPVAVLAAIKTMLAPGGVVWLTTPDAGHPRVPRDLLGWKELDPPDHVSLFSRRNLTAALGRCGLSVRRIELNLKPGIKLVAQHAG